MVQISCLFFASVAVESVDNNGERLESVTSLHSIDRSWSILVIERIVFSLCPQVGSCAFRFEVDTTYSNNFA